MKQHGKWQMGNGKWEMVLFILAICHLPSAISHAVRV